MELLPVDFSTERNPAFHSTRTVATKTRESSLPCYVTAGNGEDDTDPGLSQRLLRGSESSRIYGALTAHPQRNELCPDLNVKPGGQLYLVNYASVHYLSKMIFLIMPWHFRS